MGGGSLPAEPSCTPGLADSYLFGNGCVRVMFLDEISSLYPPFRSFSILTGALWFSAQPLKKGLQGHADPLLFVAIVGMDRFKTTAEGKKKTTKKNISTKRNMHAFHLRPFKLSPRPQSLSLCLCEGLRGLKGNVREARVSAVEQELCEASPRGELSLGGS